MRMRRVKKMLKSPLSNFPDRAIIHFDGDAFFVSVEQAKDYRLRGKPVVTGGERHIAAAMSYEAKKRGVKRGMNLRAIREVCPEAIILPSDYETYCIFARRMYNIARRWTDRVEEYSIDECFVDITGLDASLGLSYEEIAFNIKKELEMKLGITFGVGLGPNKVLAKIGSKHQKPAGFTVIAESNRKEILKDLLIERIWGIGPSLSTLLRRQGIFTALDLAEKDNSWILDHGLAKPCREIWLELRGEFVKEIETKEERGHSHSIMRTRTFSSPTSDAASIFSELSHNIEEACLRLRQNKLVTRAVTFYLKSQEFRYYSVEVPLESGTVLPHRIIEVAQNYFHKMYRKGILYRASGVTLRSLVPEGNINIDLFGATEKEDSEKEIFDRVDELNRKFGHGSIFLGSSMRMSGQGKDREPPRVATRERNIDIPYLGIVR